MDRPPVWFMRQAGRYQPEYRALRRRHSILDLAKTPELACAVTLLPVRKMAVDAAILFADILLPVEPLGARLRFSPGPVIDNPVRSPADVRRLRDFDVSEGLGFVFEAVSLVRRELAGRVPLIGFAGAPFTVASYLIEGGPSSQFVKTKAFMLEQPAAWDLLMRKVRRATAEYLKGQVAAGAQAVQLFDSWVGALSPGQYRRYVLPHSRFVLESLQGCVSGGSTSGGSASVASAEGGQSPPRSSVAPVIHFGTGTAGFLSDFASAGGDVVGVDWRIELREAWRRIGPKAIQGNLDPALLFGPRRALREAVQGVLEQAGGRRGFIFNLGHGILPGTPESQVSAVVDWVHEWKPAQPGAPARRLEGARSLATAGGGR